MCLIHDGGESWSNEGSGISIGKTDDGHILRNAQSLCLDGIEGGIGDDIVEGEDGIRRILPFQQAERSIACHIEIDFIANHQRAVDRNPVLAECLQIAMLAAAHHVEMVRTTDEGNAAGTGLYHVLGGLLCCHVAIAHHLRELVFQAAAGKEHQRYAHIMKLLEVRIVGSILRQTGDDAFHMHVEKVVQRLRLALMVLMTVGADD